MKLKKLVMTATLALSVLALAACGGSKTASPESIKTKGKLVVATSPDYAPYEFQSVIDGKNQVVGADMALAKDIADELGVELEISSMSFENVLASLQNGKADIAMAGLSVTSEREAAFDFSDAYYDGKNAILTKADKADQYKSVSDLEGKKVAVLKGSIEEGLAKEQLKKSNVVSLTNMGETINELKSGQVDAVVMEAPVALGYVNHNKDLAQITPVLEVKEGDAKAIAMPKGSKELKEAVNKVVAKAKKNGSFEKYVEEASKLTAVE